MNATLSSETQEDLDQTMRVVARNLAMGIHDLDQILTFCNVNSQDFHRWKENPRFLMYLRAETEAWNNAQNVGERTKLKAGIVMEEWLPEAYTELRDRKTPLNQRVMLGQLVAKIAGMGEPRGIGVGVAGEGGGFTLQINIGNTAHINFNNDDLKVIDAEPEPEAPQRLRAPTDFEDVNIATEPPQRVRAPYELINDELGIPEDE